MLTSLYYFRRSFNSPPTILHFYATTGCGLDRLLARLVARRLAGIIGVGRSTSRILPEAKFAYGDDLGAEFRFWRFLRWMSDIACDLLASDPSSARRVALDIHYGHLRRTPGLRSTLEPKLVAGSRSYRRLLKRGLDRELWAAFAFTGRGEPWDHWYFHLVLGVDPDPRYWNGPVQSRTKIEREVGI